MAGGAQKTKRILTDPKEIREELERRNAGRLMKRARRNVISLLILGTLAGSIYGGLRYKLQEAAIGNVLEDMEPIPPEELAQPKHVTTPTP